MKNFLFAFFGAILGASALFAGDVEDVKTLIVKDCELAANRGIPLVILYGADDGAPEYPGLPKGVRQYWQCPGCAADQMK